MKNRGIKSLAVNTAYLFGSHGVTNLIRGFYAIFLAYYLGPEVYGLYNYGLSWYLAFIPLSYFGHEVIVRREIGKNSKDIDAIASHTLFIRFCAALLTALLSVLLGLYLEEDDFLQNLLLIFSIALIGRSLALWTDIIFSSVEKSRFAFTQNTIFRFLEVTCGIAVLLGGGSILILAALNAIFWWLQAISSMVIIRRQFAHLFTVLESEKIWLLIKIGAVLGFLAILNAWMIQGPVIMLRFLGHDSGELGALALTMQAFLILFGIPWAIGNASLPILARTVERQDNKELLFMEVLLKGGCVFGMAAGLGGFSLGPFVVDFVFGSSFDKTGELMGICFWVLIPGIWLSASIQVLHAHQKTFAIFTGLIAAVVALVVTTPVLVESYGAAGSLYALAFGMTLASVITLFWLNKIIHLNLIHSVLRPSVSMLPCLLFLFVEEKGFFQFGVGIAILIACTYFFVLNMQDREILQSKFGHRKI